MNILTKVAIETIANEISTSSLGHKTAVAHAEARNNGDGWTLEIENPTGGYTRYENVTVSAENFQRAVALQRKWAAGVYVDADDPIFDAVPDVE